MAVRQKNSGSEKSRHAVSCSKVCRLATSAYQIVQVSRFWTRASQLVGHSNSDDWNWFRKGDVVRSISSLRTIKAPVGCHGRANSNTTIVVTSQRCPSHTASHSLEWRLADDGTIQHQYPSCIDSDRGIAAFSCQPSLDIDRRAEMSSRTPHLAWVKLSICA